MSGLEVAGLAARLGGFRLGPIDLDVGPGEALAIIGPSGAGKTTLLRAIAGFVPLDTGRVGLDGNDRTAWSPERRQFGYVPQGLALFPHRTVGENVGFPLEVRGSAGREARCSELLSAWGLGPNERSMISDLSGGEQQRVAMARALASDPRALLWDEPLSALDPVGRAALIEVVGTALRREGIPMLLVTHDVETAFSVADRVLVLDAGRATFYGDSAELTQRPPTTFTARFAGFENVLSPTDIRRIPDPELVRLLELESGPAGVCFPSDAVSAGTDSGADARAAVVRIRPGPAGSRVWLDIGGVELQMLARARAGEAHRLRLGDRCHLRIAPELVRPIGLPAGT